MQRNVGYAVLVLLCVLSGALSWDNVLSDPGAVTKLAEEAACKVKSCAEHHGMTKMERTPLGQTVELTWRDGAVVVECARPYLVLGDRVCRASAK